MSGISRLEDLRALEEKRAPAYFVTADLAAKIGVSKGAQQGNPKFWLAKEMLDGYPIYIYDKPGCEEAHWGNCSAMPQIQDPHA